MGFALRLVVPSVIASTMMLIAGCGSDARPPSGPSPSPMPVNMTANAYILPDAISRGDWAFGDEPIVIYKGERLRWINVDTLTHVIVADSPDDTDFRKTEELRSGGEQSFTMTKLGTTKIHCSLHPAMTGTLIVRER